MSKTVEVQMIPLAAYDLARERNRRTIRLLVAGWFLSTAASAAVAIAIVC